MWGVNGSHQSWNCRLGRWHCLPADLPRQTWWSLVDLVPLALIQIQLLLLHGNWLWADLIVIAIRHSFATRPLLSRLFGGDLVELRGCDQIDLLLVGRWVVIVAAIEAFLIAAPSLRLAHISQVERIHSSLWRASITRLVDEIVECHTWEIIQGLRIILAIVINVHRPLIVQPLMTHGYRSCLDLFRVGSSMTPLIGTFNKGLFLELPNLLRDLIRSWLLLHQSLSKWPTLKVVKVLISAQRLGLGVHQEWFGGEPWLVESVRDLHVLLCALSLHTSFPTALSLRGGLTLDHTHLLRVPDGFEVLYPVAWDLALLE